MRHLILKMPSFDQDQDRLGTNIGKALKIERRFLADWLPTAVAALALRPLTAGETLPLDGVDMWSTLLSNDTSPRTGAEGKNG